MKASRTAAGLLLMLLGCAGPEPRGGLPPPESARPAAVVGADRWPDVPTLYLTNRRGFLPLPADYPSSTIGVSAWLRSPGAADWRPLGVFYDRQERAPFEAPSDGVWYLVIQELRRDSRPAQPLLTSLRPSLRVVVDSLPPVVEILEPNGGELLGGPSPVRIRWAVRDRTLDPARSRAWVEFSKDDGKTWTPVAGDLPVDREFLWTDPCVSAAACRVRVRVVDEAGHSGLDASDGRFAIDCLKPVGRIDGPTVARTNAIELRYSVEDAGAAGIAEARLYRRLQGAAEWTLLARDEDLASPALLHLPDGLYALAACGVDRVGNVGDLPGADEEPHAMLLVDTRAPELRILTPNGAQIRGGTAVEIAWAATDETLVRDSIRIRWRPTPKDPADDGGWETVAEHLLSEQTYRWDAPRRAIEAAEIEITVRDAAGHETRVVTSPFVVLAPE